MFQAMWKPPNKIPQGLPIVSTRLMVVVETNEDRSELTMHNREEGFIDYVAGKPGAFEWAVGRVHDFQVLLLPLPQGRFDATLLPREVRLPMWAVEVHA